MSSASLEILRRQVRACCRLARRDTGFPEPRPTRNGFGLFDKGESTAQEDFGAELLPEGEQIWKV